MVGTASRGGECSDEFSDGQSSRLASFGIGRRICPRRNCYNGATVGRHGNLVRWCSAFPKQEAKRQEIVRIGCQSQIVYLSIILSDRGFSTIGTFQTLLQVADRLLCFGQVSNVTAHGVACWTNKTAHGRGDLDHKLLLCCCFSWHYFV
jgi:hypothetical protein